MCSSRKGLISCRVGILTTRTSRNTPSSQSKIRVFSDPTLGKSWRRRQTTYQQKVSGQPNPWNKSWTANSCYGNWVYGHFTGFDSSRRLILKGGNSHVRRIV